MTIFFYFYKVAPLQALTTLICGLVSIAVGVYLNLYHRTVIREMALASDDIDPEELTDAYLHPCYRKKREHENQKGKEIPLLVELDESEAETQSLLVNS